MNVIFHHTIDHFMKVYIDDIVIKLKDKGEHMKELRLAFERIRKYELKMNPLKCALGLSVDFFFKDSLYIREELK